MVLIIAITCLTVLITGCNPSGNRNIPLGQLILNHDQISTVEVIEGPSDTNKDTLTEPSHITELLGMIEPIPLTSLSKQEDIDFMSKRMFETHFAVDFENYDDPNRSLQGIFLIWPDGLIYATDVNSMSSNQRTVSYLSQTQYPEVYEWLNERAGKNY